MYEKTYLIDILEGYEDEAQHYMMLKNFLSLLISFLAYGFIGLILSFFPSYILSIENLFLMINLVKLALFFLIAILLTFAAVLAALGGGGSIGLSMYAGFVIASLFIGVSYEFIPGIENPGYLLNIIKLENLIYSGILFGMVISSLFLIGFIRKGALENLIYSLLIIYFGIIFAFIYSGPETLGFIRFDDLREMYKLIISRSFLIFFISFVLFELGGTYSQIFTQLKYLSDRTNRVLKQISRVYTVKEEVEEERPATEIEKPALFMKLSPLAASMLRDAYEGYAFLGEGTSLYVSSKLKSFVEFELTKDPELLDRIMGHEITAQFSLVSVVILLVAKLIMSSLLMIGAFYVTSYMLTNVGYGYIYETQNPLSFVVATYFIIFVFYIAVELLFRQRESRKISEEI